MIARDRWMSLATSYGVDRVVSPERKPGSGLLILDGRYWCNDDLRSVQICAMMLLCDSCDRIEEED